MKIYAIPYCGVISLRAKSKKEALKRVKATIAKALDDTEMDTPAFDLISTLTTKE